jgi:ABC-type branched-subunit amino acid transport system permease subunit
VSAILAGLPAGELSLANTVLSAVIAGGMGVLAASLAQLDATTLPLQVVAALGAVLFARFTSFAITCAVGISIGVLQSLLYVVITGFIGQVSLMQVALAGASGFVVSHLFKDAGIGFPLAAIAGVVAATVLGFVAGVSALRVRGVSLAVVTLAAAVAIEQFGFANATWGAGATGSPVPELKLAGIDLGTRASFRGLDGNLPSPILGFVVLAAVIALALLVANLRRSGLGQRMLAVRSNERAAAAAGINVRNTKFAAYAISSFIAGVGGTLYYASTQTWFPTDKGAALPGISALLTFIIIVIALYVRGSSLPTRGELVEQMRSAASCARAAAWSSTAASCRGWRLTSARGAASRARGRPASCSTI